MKKLIYTIFIIILFSAVCFPVYGSINLTLDENGSVVDTENKILEANSDLSGNGISNIIDALKDLGITIIDGVVKALKLVVDEVVTNVLRIVIGKDKDNVIGSETFPAYATEYQIKNSLVEANSKIFISFTSDTGGKTWYVSGKVSGTGFTVRLSDVAVEPLSFDYWIVLVEGESNSDTSNQPVQPEPRCGDGTIYAGEACDDGNNIDGDGCSATCEIEPHSLPESPSLTPSPEPTPEPTPAPTPEPGAMPTPEQIPVSEPAL